jgi:hypothetical protein
MNNTRKHARAAARKNSKNIQNQMVDEPTYLEAIQTFSSMVALINRAGSSFFANDPRVILQLEMGTDGFGRLTPEATKVSFWEIDGDELMMALPAGDNVLALGIEEALTGLADSEPFHPLHDEPMPPAVFMVYHALCSGASLWLEEQVYPIIRDRVFPIPRSLGATLLLSDATGESLDIWQDNDKAFSSSVLDAVRRSLHERALHAG